MDVKFKLHIIMDYKNSLVTSIIVMEFKLHIIIDMKFFDNDVFGYKNKYFY